MGISSAPPPEERGGAWTWLRSRLLGAIGRRLREPRWRGLDASAAVGGVALLVTGLARRQMPLAFLGLLLASMSALLFVIRVGRSVAARFGLGGLLHGLMLVGERRLLGDPALALRKRDALVALLPDRTVPWFAVNDAVNALINAGCYREALALPEHWSAEAHAAGVDDDPTAFGLVQVNLAEAEYNLGSVQAAADRMLRLAAMLEDRTSPLGSERVAPIVANGMRVQSAWIAGLQDDPERGLALIDAVDERALPYPYRAEVDYTFAFLLLKAGRLREAETAADAGFERATRPSSERNGLFLIGLILAERGDLETADRVFERGAAHQYAGQGGDGLLRWGQVLSELKRPHEARQALEHCMSRDPQSPAAQVAATLLDRMAAE